VRERGREMGGKRERELEREREREERERERERVCVCVSAPAQSPPFASPLRTPAHQGEGFRIWDGGFVFRAEG
jgi:hypothetical protein